MINRRALIKRRNLCACALLPAFFGGVPLAMAYVGAFLRLSGHDNEIFQGVQIAAAAVGGLVLCISAVFWCVACGAIRERYQLRRRFLATAQVNVKRLEGQQPTVLDGPTPGNIAESCAVCGSDVPPTQLSCHHCHAVALDRLCVNVFRWQPIAASTATVAVAVRPAAAAAAASTAHAIAVAGIQAALGANDDDDDDDGVDGKADNKSDESASSEGKCCSICLDELAEGDLVVALPCLHIFHETCITGWLKTQFTCAECSVPVV